MKKRIALLLAAVLCLSLCACGNGKKEANTDHSQGQNTESTPNESGQAETAPQEQTIEITLDNWQEYIEINQYLSVTYTANAFGELTDTSLRFFTILEPKEAYAYYTVDVAVEYSVDYCTRDITYNLDDFSFALTDCVSHPDAAVDESTFRQQETSSMSNFFPMSRDRIVDGKVEKNTVAYVADESYPPSFATLIDEQPIEQNEDGTGYLRLCPTNIRITRIEGTLEYND